MENKEEKQKMRKMNMKIFPIYKAIGWDFLFFYTIDFLFLTQVKGITPADVVLKTTFYSFFTVLMQIPANIIVEFFGRKNSIIIGNILNCLYMVILLLCRNFADLLFAEFIDALAFSIRDIAQASLLNESVPPSKYKSKIFSKLNSKGATGYYIIDAITKVIAGYLFSKNGYLPIICSFIVLVLVTVISLFFIEPVNKKKKTTNEMIGKKEIKDVKDGFVYILKSERLKALIVCASLISSLLAILTNYHVSLLRDLSTSPLTIGIIAAIGRLISAVASKKQEVFHKKLKNKSLEVIAMLLSISTIIGGICGLEANNFVILLIVVVLTNLIFNFCNGMYYTIIDKYLRNFTNKKIDIKIFAAKNFFSSIVKVISGLFAAFILDKMKTSYCMIAIGIIFTIIYFLMIKYMKTRVGLKPSEYSKEEIKYAEQDIELNLGGSKNV